MEEKKTSVLRVLTDITEAKSFSNGDSLRSFKETSDSPPPSLDDLRNLQQTKRLLHKKNQLNPLFANHPYRFAGFQVHRAASSRPKPKDLSQRIVSAKLLQIKELRNQLTLSQHQLNEVTNENRFLKTLQKRQEAALRKYEGHEARLPQLIQAHSEELRVLNTKLKQVRHTNQRLVEKLKTAENQLTSLQQEHCHLIELSRDQRLGEREALAEQVQVLQMSLCDKTNTVQLLTRKVDLERKNYKHELGIEKNKRNEVERKLSLAMQTIENLKDQIEAKEKCMNAMVPSRYVRGPSQPSLNSSRLTHTQIPRKLNSDQTLTNAKSNVMPRRSSTDHTEDEMDVAESRNSKTTSDSTRTLSGTTLPKIKPQMSSRALRNQFKMSNNRIVQKERSINDDSPDYSSSFTSVDVSLKDLRKNSDSECEKLIQAKRQVASQRNSSRSRKFSVDSGVINKSESGKVTQRTDQSRVSSSKTRRNSVSVCPTGSTKEGKQYFQQESLAAKEETHKSIKEELKELEEKLLQGTSFSEISKTKKSFDTEDKDAKDVFKGECETPRDGSEDESDQYNGDHLDDEAWSKIHERVKAESDAAEAKLEMYYNSLEKSELNLEETENYIALEQEQKERLLKALKEIDREAEGVSSASSVEDPEHSVSLSYGSTRRKSDGFNYNFSKNVENLHKGRPVHNNVKVPVIEKMKKEEKEYLLNIENGKKNKEDFMKELFGKLNMNLDSESFSNSESPNKREQLLQLNRSFD